jgi:hypothetical protein
MSQTIASVSRQNVMYGFRVFQATSARISTVYRPFFALHGRTQGILAK